MVKNQLIFVYSLKCLKRTIMYILIYVEQLMSILITNTGDIYDPVFPFLLEIHDVTTRIRNLLNEFNIIRF